MHMQPEFSSVHRILSGYSSFPASERATSASENHKEAERKRRRRINGHLDTLRALLRCTSKTDKATLLAKAVESVRELKQAASEITRSEQASFPSEADELIVLLKHEPIDGKVFIKATLSCDDRVDLMADLIDILKPLPLRLVRAEFVTLGGRVMNVMVLVGENDEGKDRMDEMVVSLRDALKAIVLSAPPGYAGGRVKRRRMFDPTVTI